MAEEKRVKVVYPNGFRTEHRKSVADVLLKRGSVETPTQYARRIEREIEEKKPEDDPPEDDQPDDDPVDDDPDESGELPGDDPGGDEPDEPRDPPEDDPEVDEAE